MLTSSELSISKENPICAEHQHWVLALWNALTGRRLLFASTFFFTRAKSLISVSATPEQSGMCSLGAAEIPAASCQEFINYKNRSAACVLCQHVASRSLTVCVYATTDSAGVCCTLQGDKEMTVNSRPCSFIAYVKIRCLHHTGENAQICDVTPPISRLLGYLHGQTSKVDRIHILFQGQLTISLLLRSVEMETSLSQAEPWSSLIRPLELLSCRRIAFLDFIDRNQYARVSDLFCASQSSSTGRCGLALFCTTQGSGAKSFVLPDWYESSKFQLKCNPILRQLKNIKLVLSFLTASKAAVCNFRIYQEV